MQKKPTDVRQEPTNTNENGNYNLGFQVSWNGFRKRKLINPKFWGMDVGVAAGIRCSSLTTVRIGVPLTRQAVK